MIRAVKGMRDLLPPQTAVWNRVERVAREVFSSYNYQEIRTPILEETQLFALQSSYEPSGLSGQRLDRNKCDELFDVLSSAFGSLWRLGSIDPMHKLRDGYRR